MSVALVTAQAARSLDEAIAARPAAEQLADELTWEAANDHVAYTEARDELAAAEAALEAAAVAYAGDWAQVEQYTLNSTAPDSGPQQWKDVMGWIGLQVGMSADEVLALLGPDYRERVNAESTMWTYQDQKALLFGSVSFKDGKLENWTSPRF